MNRRFSLPAAALMAAAILAVFSGSAFALTLAHQAVTTSGIAGVTGQGDCSYCHIPHKAQGSQRLFVVEPTTVAQGMYGYIGAMCAEYCHDKLATLPRAYAGNTALNGPPGGNTTPDPTSAPAHGLNLVTTVMPANTIVAASLPYGNDGRGRNSQNVVGSFECTTCHDPHKNAPGPPVDASEALLRVEIDEICTVCHLERGLGAGAWAGYGDTNAQGTTLNASHPVGTNVTGDNDGTPNSNIFIGMANAAGGTVFDAPYGGSSAHNLGGHLIDGVAKDGADNGPVTCATCHAVHGLQADSGDETASPAPSGPFEDLLAIQQGFQGTSESIGTGLNANGGNNVMQSNGLCAGCHGYTTAAINDYNPGATAFSHPANGTPATNNMGAITEPGLGWPYGLNTDVVPNLDLAVICESCHKPHGATTNSHILRADELEICSLCHTSAPANHHPAGVVMCAPMADADIDGGIVGTLECADCHNGNGAHNWLGAGEVGLNPNWEPTNNARGAADVVGQIATNLGKECMDCHLGGLVQNSPTCRNGNAPTNGGVDTLENRGDGSHYIGDTTDAILALGDRSGVAFNPTTDLWNATGYSRWSTASGTGDRANVCESCHELEFDKNVAGTALLLFNYHERYDVAQADFCTGCHGVTPSGNGTHPLTGSTITAQEDNAKVGRPAVLTLVNDPSGFADAAGAPNLAEYPGGVTTNNRTNCDSCHQPHDTSTDGGSFILEYGGVGGLGKLNSDVSGLTLPTHRAASDQNIDHRDLCIQCHNY